MNMQMLFKTMTSLFVKNIFEVYPYIVLPGPTRPKNTWCDIGFRDMHILINICWCIFQIIKILWTIYLGIAYFFLFATVLT